MHEIGIVRQMLRTVPDFAAENDIDDIREIIVDCGELSLVVPEYLYEVYPVVVPGSILSNAKLTVNMVPGMAECNECDEIFNVVEQKGYCPVCGSFDKTILTGREFSIREIVVPDTGPESSQGEA